jgi:hypothetical protein
MAGWVYKCHQKQASYNATDKTLTGACERMSSDNTRKNVEENLKTMDLTCNISTIHRIISQRTLVGIPQATGKTQTLMGR